MAKLNHEILNSQGLTPGYVNKDLQPEIDKASQLEQRLQEADRRQKLLRRFAIAMTNKINEASELKQ